MDNCKALQKICQCAGNILGVLYTSQQQIRQLRQLVGLIEQDVRHIQQHSRATGEGNPAIRFF